MGEVISKQAAVEDILADVHATLANAAVRGGVWHADAERMLRPAANLAHEVDRDLAATTVTVVGATRVLEVRDDESDDLLARIYDEIYNLLGRPGAGSDPVFELLFPGGSTTYRETPTQEQPIVMLMLARLLDRNLHPKIPPATAAAYATEIRASATALRDAVHALAAPAAEAKMLETMRATTARSGQVHLARLKKMWKAQGMSEADIHAVIPDRPRKKAAAKVEAPPESDAAPPS
jgi:hypothetical protein